NSKALVPSIADAQVTEVIERINAPGGGVFAIVGERGAGKTTLLQRIAAEAEDVHVVSCPFGGMQAFEPVLLKVFGALPSTSMGQAAAAIDTSERQVGVLIDDAHRLITPIMGG